MLQVTGLEESSSTFKAILGSFNALKAFADFAAKQEPAVEEEQTPEEHAAVAPISPPAGMGVNLGYTINLHLPPTSDIAVFNAIFKSLREYLLPK